jgi:hypothetical protein
MTKAIYRFVSRTDDGEEVIVRVEIVGDEVIWSGKSDKHIKMMKDMLTGDEWFQLDGHNFDLHNLEHYAKLPEIIRGTRLWVAKKTD